MEVQGIRKAKAANATICRRVTDGIAEWVDRSGCKRTALVQGDRIVIQSAKWIDDRGKTKTGFLDHTGEALLIADQYWRGSFTDEHGKRQRKSTKTSDKAAAQRIAKKWEADAQLRVEGVVDSIDESLARHAAVPIADHVVAYIKFRATKGGTEKHRERTRKHIDEFITVGEWESIRDICADDVADHVDTMKGKNSAARTIEGRLQSIKGFTRWCAKTHRLKLDPLSMVQKPDPKSDRRHERRMLLPDEWPWLESAVRDSEGIRNGMDGAERALLYSLAIQTGLRAGELGQLTRGKMVLTAKTLHVLCKAAGTKNRKPAKQYVDAALAAGLKRFVAAKHPKAPVFSIVSLEELSDTVEKDLALARSRWQKTLSGDARIESEGSDFLALTNHENEKLVFHSMRHTCGAWLALAGEHPKVVQTVMRHATIGLTMDTYGHLFPGQTEEAPAKIAAVMADARRRQNAG